MGIEPALTVSTYTGIPAAGLQERATLPAGRSCETNALYRQSGRYKPILYNPLERFYYSIRKWYHWIRYNQKIIWIFNASLQWRILKNLFSYAALLQMKCSGVTSCTTWLANDTQLIHGFDLIRKQLHDLRHSLYTPVPLLHNETNSCRLKMWRDAAYTCMAVLRESLFPHVNGTNYRHGKQARIQGDVTVFYWR